ncbi:MAG TPA: metallophosphoesterase, partial [Victivallales bacterium]|nr:metallophosphoesterase [Victivallales bacterium]
NFFTLIVLPDTQNYVKYEGNDKKFLKQCKWIVENKENLNIRFVLHEGDITDDNSPEQWEKAKNCMSILDGKIPYALCVGNHDISKNSKLSLIEKYFPETAFSNQKWWGGKMPEENCFWYKFEAYQNKFIIISLDFGPSDKMLNWADSVVESNKDCKAIFLTHELLDENGRLSERNTKKSSSHYGIRSDGSSYNTGIEIWEKHLSKHSNYFLAICGHYGGIASRAELTGKTGNKVHILMANYQYFEGGGNAFLRILKFDKNLKKCDILTYSPFLDKFLNDEKNNFTIKW